MKIRDIYTCCSNVRYNATFHITTDEDVYLTRQQTETSFSMEDMPNELYYDRDIRNFRIDDEYNVTVFIKEVEA